MKRALGVCYYPEHWPEDRWTIDAAQMVEAGLTWVRIGEFAWSRLEPTPGDLHLDWLDRAIDVLGAAGLQVIIGTPTATPPRWMLDKHPDMLAHDEQGRPRGFGSRRHYCFSHVGYLDECRRITRILAERFGANPYVTAWQTDNEYGCHETTVSYSHAATRAFQDWCAQTYQSTDALNRAWGNIFWSMEYDRFDQIALPNLTVTEPNPAHVLAFRRFSSDQVVRFNRAQTDILRQHTDAPLIHNYMGRVTDFDHYAVGADLDIASWDSYPIGFLSDRLEATPEHKARYLRQGDPDMQAFHHDLYRAVGRGRWWVMEQQPGPVNWAPYNPAPLPGMARLWAWEAFAHGAEAVLYFRWRQAPFAQEQMHAGLLRPDAQPAPALAEARQVADELAALPEVGTARARTALIFDYASCWAWEAQPQGADFNMFRLAFETYRAARRLGLSLDIIAPDADLSDYDLVLAPGLLETPETIENYTGTALIGPRTGSKTAEMNIPLPMGPNIPGFDCKAVRVESLPPTARIELENGGAFLHWFEGLVGNAEVALKTKSGAPAIMRANGLHYIAGWPEADTYVDILEKLAQDAKIEITRLPDGLRLRDTETHRFWFNYAPDTIIFQGKTIKAAALLIEPL
ncbi:beta-galactosidase [Planktotalea arctica]|uniref:beta-galactosidase n=1 Tax=Planktotalea arctica TaxID=1481893 RepID=UPI000A16DD41|nr:beta-galactosidase [Planktotalea arctica]